MKQRERYKKRIIAMRGKGQWEKHEGHSIHHAYDSLMLPYIPQRFFVEWGCDRTRVTRGKKTKSGHNERHITNGLTKEAVPLRVLFKRYSNGRPVFMIQPRDPSAEPGRRWWRVIKYGRTEGERGKAGKGKTDTWLTGKDKGGWLPNVPVWEWFREGCPILFLI